MKCGKCPHFLQLYEHKSCAITHNRTRAHCECDLSSLLGFDLWEAENERRVLARVLELIFAEADVNMLTLYTHETKLETWLVRARAELEAECKAKKEKK